ncbi:hypothetical protein GDO78_014881, partial [Eleutherodactylus coqui]
ECVEDSLTPLRISLNFSLIGNPVLSEDSRTSRSGEILFEKNCGADGVCEDDLEMNLTFTSLQPLVVGLSLDVNLTVSVTNKGEESYNARVLIPFPPDLSYRRVSLLQSNKRATITCATEEDQRVVSCGVNRPLLRPNTTNCFVGTCLQIVCNISNLKERESVTFTISGVVTKNWETQTEQKKVSLQSSAEIQYNLQEYFMQQNFTKAQTQTVLEVIVQYNYLPVIIGSSVGGLVLLALITAGLYKLGFFKRQYKDMLQTTEGANAGDTAALGSPADGVPE